jgi:hypothetical protein
MFVSFRFDGDIWWAGEARWVEFDVAIDKHDCKLQVTFRVQVCDYYYGDDEKLRGYIRQT